MTNFGYWEKEFGNVDTRGLQAGCSMSLKESDALNDAIKKANQTGIPVKSKRNQKDVICHPDGRVENVNE